MSDDDRPCFWAYYGIGDIRPINPVTGRDLRNQAFIADVLARTTIHGIRPPQPKTPAAAATAGRTAWQAAFAARLREIQRGQQHDHN